MNKKGNNKAEIAEQEYQMAHDSIWDIYSISDWELVEEPQEKNP